MVPRKPSGADWADSYSVQVTVSNLVEDSIQPPAQEALESTHVGVWLGRTSEA